MKKRQLMILYTVLLCLSVIFVQYKSIMVLLVIMLNAIAVLTNRKLSGIVLMSSFILPGEIFPIINVCMTILLNAKKIQYRKPSRKYMVYFLFIFAISVISAVKYGTFINVFIYTACIIYIYMFLCFAFDKIKVSDMTYSIKWFICIEFLADIIIAAQSRIFMPGDRFFGTMSNAHWMGNWAIICLVTLLFAQHILLEMRWKNILSKNYIFIIANILIIWLADCKLLIAALLAGTILYYIFDKILKLKNGFLVGFVVFSILIFTLSFTINLPYIKNIVTSCFPTYSIYIYKSDNDFNGKTIYIISTFAKQLKGIRFFIGYGLGQYGSRVANLFAYTEMWRNNNFINNFIANNFAPSFLPEYSQYITYFTDDFVQIIPYRSAILSYPFNSFTALFAELGVVGAVIFAKLVNEYTKNSACKILAFYFMVACVFDIYFDDFTCIGFLIFIIVNTQSKIDNRC